MLVSFECMTHMQDRAIRTSSFSRSRKRSDPDNDAFSSLLATQRDAGQAEVAPFPKARVEQSPDTSAVLIGLGRCNCMDPMSAESASSQEFAAMGAALQAAERGCARFRDDPDAMIIIDERGRVDRPATAERLFGYAATEVIGRTSDADAAAAPWRGSYFKRYLKTGERRIIGIGRAVVGQRDGTTFPMHLTVGELRLADRHISRLHPRPTDQR
jgi:PAS domain S-box-containing protein